MLLTEVGFFKLPFDGENMEKHLNKDYEELMLVVDYLENSGYDNIHIRIKRNEVTINIEIDDEKILETINELKRKSYQYIEKKDGIIYFERWVKFDKGAGAAYSIDGHIPGESSIEFLTKIESLSIDKWYYYEEDYNEWRSGKQKHP